MLLPCIEEQLTKKEGSLTLMKWKEELVRLSLKTNPNLLHTIRLLHLKHLDNYKV